MEEKIIKPVAIGNPIEKEEIVIKVNYEELEKQVETKRLELKHKLKCDVHSFIIKIKEDDYAVVFLREPLRLVKIKCIDILLSQKTPATAADILIGSCLISEASDERLHTDDAIYMSLIMNAMDLVEYYSEVVKKKKLTRLNK